MLPVGILLNFHALDVLTNHTVSRARSLEGLQVISLPPSSKMQSGNPQVKEFLHEKFGL